MKSGQLSVFVIIGLMILILTSLLVFQVFKEKEKISVDNVQKDSNSENQIFLIIDNCIKENLISSLDKKGLSDPIGFEDYFKRGFLYCIELDDNLDIEVEIKSDEIKIDKEISKENIDIFLNLPVIINKGENRIFRSNFYHTLPLASKLELSTNQEGLTLKRHNLLSPDRRLLLVIPENTLVLDKEGNPVKNITITIKEDQSSGPSKVRYTLEPDGTSFDKQISMVYDYTFLDFDRFSDFTLMYQHEGIWINFPCLNDIINRKLECFTDHFTDIKVNEQVVLQGFPIQSAGTPKIYITSSEIINALQYSTVEELKDKGNETDESNMPEKIYGFKKTPTGSYITPFRIEDNKIYWAEINYPKVEEGYYFVIAPLIEQYWAKQVSSSAKVYIAPTSKGYSIEALTDEEGNPLEGIEILSSADPSDEFVNPKEYMGIYFFKTAGDKTIAVVGKAEKGEQNYLQWIELSPKSGWALSDRKQKICKCKETCSNDCRIFNNYGEIPEIFVSCDDEFCYSYEEGGDIKLNIEGSIVLFGDSITKGMEICNNALNPFKNALREAGNTNVILSGVKSESAASSLLRIDELINLNPSIIILWHGVNQPDDTEGYKNSYRKIISKLIKRGITPAIATPIPKCINNKLNPITEIKRSAYELDSEFGEDLILIDVSADIEREFSQGCQRYYYGDGIHPSCMPSERDIFKVAAESMIKALANEFGKNKNLWSYSYRPTNFKDPKRDREIDCIVIHYSLQPNPQATDSILRSRHLSTHYILGRDCSIIQQVPDEEVAWHAGCPENQCRASCPVCFDNGVYTNPNSRCIGIEVDNYGYTCQEKSSIQCTGVLTNQHSKVEGSWEIYNPMQMKCLAELVATLVTKHNIPPDRDHILGHDEIDARKSDPGPAFDWDWLMSAITDKQYQHSLIKNFFK